MGRKQDKKRLKAAKQQKAPKSLEPFDKYKYYMMAVQSPESDATFLQKVYGECRDALPTAPILREDFCGTFAICCEWVKSGTGYIAYGVDLDPEPLKYGKDHYLSKLTQDEQSRVTIHQADVLSKDLPNADIVAALNFSYFIFKDRSTLKEYFTNVFDTLNEQGILVLDCFGGSKCYEANVEETEYEDEKFSYFWDQDTFEPLTNEAQFFIHFKRRGEKKQLGCFSYDWRLWSIPELRDLAKEVGFREVHVYWEGTTDDGEGNGEFTKVDEGEDCESWVAYLAFEK